MNSIINIRYFIELYSPVCTRVHICGFRCVTLHAYSAITRRDLDYRI